MLVHKLILCLKFPLSILSILVYLSLKDRTIVDADLKKIGLGSGVWNLHKGLNENCPFRTIFRFRVHEESVFKYALIQWPYKPLQDLELSSKNGIGEGLAIWHGYGAVIHCNKIGKNCQFFQNVTIGKGKYQGNGTPIANIGNGVSVYTGAIIIGGVTIGDNCNIGAGAVVTKDVPPNCTVVGNPMRIIQHEDKKC